MSRWNLVYDDFRPDKERLREALCTLGNGYFATRGAAPEARADEHHYPGTYLAGGYDRLSTEINGQSVENEDLVNLPNWLVLTFRIGDGEWLDLRRVELHDHRQELDLERGVLERTARFSDAQGRTTRIRERRLVHVASPHLAALAMEITPENWAGTLRLHTGIDGRVTNDGVERYQALNGNHLKPVGARPLDANTLFLEVRTRQSHLHVAEAVRTRLFSDGAPLEIEPEFIGEAGYVAHEYAVEVREGTPLVAEKVLALYSSQDRAIAECGLEARQAVARAPGFEELLREHTLVWQQLWRRFDIELTEADPTEARREVCILHLHIFHLLQTASPNIIELDAGIPARGLHGEAYRGHIFWDELFTFPLFNYRMPEITRSVMRYRYRRLDAARRAAQAEGFRGAVYPWQSGSNGREESQSLHLNPQSGRWIRDNSHLQRHVNGAIVYNIWQYYQITNDLAFLAFYGAEMMAEIARFWASLATYNPQRERYEIRGVMGPDEYHDAYPDREQPGLDNNAYTNVMAAWGLCRASELPTVLPQSLWEDLAERLGLEDEELERWEEISRRMFIPFHDEGIISQFEGYERLEEFDWEGYRQRYGKIDRLDRILEAEDDTPNRYKASKQADVLMLFYLFSAEELTELFERLGYPFEGETIPRNIEYYTQRTSHGSTLSRVVHSWVLARGDRPRSWELFTKALGSDISDIQGGTTEEGVHLGAMAGTVDLVERGYTGLEARGDVLYLNPSLPHDLERLTMNLRYRGYRLNLEIGHESVTVRADEGGPHPLRLGYAGELHELTAGQTWTQERKK